MKGADKSGKAFGLSRTYIRPQDAEALEEHTGGSNASGLLRPSSAELDFTSDNPKGVEKSGLASLLGRGLISLSGPDTAKFLQGLITNNVNHVSEAVPGHDTISKPPIDRRSRGFYSAFLDARGRVLWDVFIYRKDGVTSTKPWECYIEVDMGEAEALIKHLKRHKLRSKINIEKVPLQEYVVFQAWGRDLDIDEHFTYIPHAVDQRFEKNAIRFLARNGDPPLGLKLPILDYQAYRLWRYLHGIPEGPLEIPRESALPMEYNIDLGHGIDFKKGCYVGQELTIRTKHTGIVRKRVLAVQLSTSPIPANLEAPLYDRKFPSNLIPANGAEIKQLDEDGNVKKGRPAGKFISAAGNVGIALVRLEMMTSMRVSAEGGSWKPGMQFGIQSEGGEVLRVKAFAPQWFKERERNLWDKNRKRVFGEGGRESGE
ncbi:Aminomethyltransferase folate-binding domain-containing protein [Byssothecium circinans]|uniref:Iron-sulfur cluster assembly factor IBA57 homolog, mitochondrial n=1 Tax=Byssothecium circinans TaxID=147558 RepID=A0A6A5U6Y6_9PLEO|nr:Aminomethyltransferase folate-binding domain-containing protein [Byssothecium circinans]